MRHQLWLRLSRWILVSIILVCIGLIVANTAAQMTMTDWIDRRLTVIESQNLFGRVLVLESEMVEIKWLSRTAVVALIGQFAAALMRTMKRQQNEK
jgi:hypothetical protein